MHQGSGASVEWTFTVPQTDVSDTQLTAQITSVDNRGSSDQRLPTRKVRIPNEMSCTATASCCRLSLLLLPLTALLLTTASNYCLICCCLSLLPCLTLYCLSLRWLIVLPLSLVHRQVRGHVVSGCLDDLTAQLVTCSPVSRLAMRLCLTHEWSHSTRT